MELNVVVPMLVNAVIVVTIIEGTALLAYYKLTGAGVSPGDYLLNLVSGLCLMAALRSSLLENGFHWMLLWLLFAGIAHVTDLIKRWKRRVTADMASSASARPLP